MKFLEDQLEDPGRLAQIKLWFYRSLVVIAVAEAAALLILWLSGHLHAHFWFENIPAFGSLYGLVSCVLIIVVSKFLGKVWLMRPEDYYDS